MNFLREVRRVKSKSIKHKLIILCVLGVLLIANTYAWFTNCKEITVANIQAEVKEWTVSYFVRGEEVLDEYVTFTRDSFAPSYDREDNIVNIYNMTNFTSNISYQITSVKLFGEEVLTDLNTNGEIAQDEDGKIILFANTDDTNIKYPFSIYYQYDKTTISGVYNSDADTNAMAQLVFSSEWESEDENNEIDTYYGKKAYEFYQDEANEGKEAIEVTIRITSSRADFN